MRLGGNDDAWPRGDSATTDSCSENWRRNSVNMRNSVTDDTSVMKARAFVVAEHSALHRQSPLQSGR